MIFLLKLRKRLKGGNLMSKPKSGHFRGTNGTKAEKKPIFSDTGYVTIDSISERREFFLGKSAARLEHELQKHGYETTRRPSKNRGSKAKIIITLNSDKEKNIAHLQISPGSKRHGNVPYVKISTTDIGKIKIIGADESQYKTDGKEKATILFRRKNSEL